MGEWGVINTVTFGDFKVKHAGHHSDDKFLAEQMASCLELAGFQLKGAN